MDCIDPPLDEPPDGEWHCPRCPPVIPEELQILVGQHFQENGYFDDNNPMDVTGEPSPSHLVAEVLPRRGRRKTGRKGKGRTSRVAPIADTSEVDDNVGIEVDDTPVVTPKIRARPRKSGICQKGLPSQNSDEEEVSNTLARAPRRRRSTQIPITPPPGTSLRVRLRIPVRGKGKEREEEEEPSFGLLDDILSPEERDTNKTTITNNDKLYFERSRVTAEVKAIT